jgi:hypothetical protein
MVRTRAARWIAVAAGAIACARVEQIRPRSDGGPMSTTTDAALPAADVATTTDRWTAPELPAFPEAGPRPDAMDTMTTPGADAACATQSAKAETLPLDLHVMVDSSGSMTGLTTAGTSKWDAVRAALKSFFSNPQSAGLGVSLQYFPQLQPGVPATCNSDAACAGFGPCDRFRTCYGPTTTTIVTCTSSATCRAGESCVLLGQCPLAGGTCAPIGATCLLGDPCIQLDGNCHARDRCDVPAYATPAVPAATLPAAAAALATSLDQRTPDGLTPTGPALAGAIQSATTRAAAVADRKPAVVLVTDGLPTECTPLDIPGIAALAATGAAGTPAIPTFVIGVFAPDEAATASANLNALAAAGGTGTAVVINTNQNVTQALQTALDRIRTMAVACEYKIPPATTGTIDFRKVNVQLTGAGGAMTTIGYVNGRAACDPVRGGWYYDVDPATGQSPTSIIVCESTCAQFRGDAAARVDIVLGCATVIITLNDRVDRSKTSNDDIRAIPRIGRRPPC